MADVKAKLTGLALVRRKLQNIGALAQDGLLDLDTMDDICRASLDALRALDEYERKPLAEELAPGAQKKAA